MLSIRHSLEDQLIESGIGLLAVPSRDVNALVETLVPGPSALDSLRLLAMPWSRQLTAPVTVNISPQVINAMQSTIIQSVQGTMHLGPQAKQLLALIEDYGGQEAPILQSAVHELEDPAAPPASKSAASRRLKQFLSQVARSARDVGVDLLAKYLESKGF